MQAPGRRGADGSSRLLRSLVSVYRRGMTQTATPSRSPRGIAHPDAAARSSATPSHISVGRGRAAPTPESTPIGLNPNCS